LLVFVLAKIRIDKPTNFDNGLSKMKNPKMKKGKYFPFPFLAFH